MFTLHGGLNISSVFNHAEGIPQRRAPFTWMLNGNVTGSFLGISLPFVFNYSNNQVNYSQTYNIKSFNPSYKWIKGYAGTTSMNFSAYTMSGHVFNGGGIELNPKNFRFAAAFGQFRKAVNYDFLNSSDLNMSYRRMGGGLMAGYEQGSNGIKLIYFAAKDDVRSLQFIPSSTELKPMQNAVLSINGRSLLLKKINVDVEYALSSLNRNLYVNDNVTGTPHALYSLLPTGKNSALYSALKASLGYRFKMAAIAFNYEKIDPGYQTLGAYYFNNDLINYSIAPSLNLFQGKLNLSGNAGLQKNNLDNEKLNTTKRFVAACNLSFAPNKNWNLMGSYSNFNSYTRQRPVSDPFYRNSLDTLNFYQISQSSMVSISYQFGNKSYRQNILLTGNYQKSGQTQATVSDQGFYNPVLEISTPNKNLNVNSSYNLLVARHKLTLSLAANCNQSYFNELNILFYGPSINAGKSFYKNKLRLSAGSTYNRAETNAVLSSNVISNRINCSFNPLSGKGGNLSFSASVASVQRFSVQPGAISFTEYNGNLSLNYNF